jgi:DNA-binding transcriptional LysR family regulator
MSLTQMGRRFLADAKDLLSGLLVRVLRQCNLKDLPVHVVYAGHRLLPERVRAFIDFAVNYMIKELEPNA